MSECQITEYNETAAAIAMLRNKYNTVFDVSTPKGLTAAREARAEIRSYRVSLEKLRVEIKAPALERARLIDTEAKRITVELLAIEVPIDAAIKAEEARKAEERAAKERAEQARTAEIQNRIAAMRSTVTAAFNKPSAFTAELMVKVRAVPVTAVEFSEFLAIAETAKAETLESLAGLLAEQQAHEAEQARIVAEREELARLRAQDEQRQAEQRRIEAEERAKVEAAAVEVRKAQAEEQARIAAAQAELDKRQRLLEEAEAKARAEVEAKQRAEAEAQAKAAKAKPRGKAKADPLEGIKQALADGTVSPLEAVEQAYQLGYSAGYSAGMDDYL